jgi:enoyl-CoA hydratase
VEGVRVSDPVLTLGREGHVAVLTLERPDALNALSRAVADDILAATAGLAGDSGVRVVVVTGAGGRAFCAGADIAEMGALSGADDFFSFIGHLERAVAAIATLPQPTIAAIEGLALGGGLELALACDFRVVSDTARLGLPEVKLGLLPGLGGTQRAIRMLPRAVATRMVMLGEPLDAATAHRYGLCEAPVAVGDALRAARELADRLAAGAPLALAAAKRLIRDGAELPLTQAIQLEQDVGRRLFASSDAVEGVTAFLAKRVASFEGR